jgi:hypothetical protein
VRLRIEGGQRGVNANATAAAAVLGERRRTGTPRWSASALRCTAAAAVGRAAAAAAAAAPCLVPRLRGRGLAVRASNPRSCATRRRTPSDPGRWWARWHRRSISAAMHRRACATAASLRGCRAEPGGVRSKQPAACTDIGAATASMRALLARSRARCAEYISPLCGPRLPPSPSSPGPPGCCGRFYAASCVLSTVRRVRRAEQGAGICVSAARYLERAF